MSTANDTPKKKRGRMGCLLGCGAVVLILGFGLVVAAVAGYFLVQNGTLSLSALNGLLPAGLSGDASIELSNLSDATVDVRLERLNMPEDSEDVEERTLQDYEIDTIRGISPDEYLLTIDTSATGPGSYSCQLTVRGGTNYALVVLQEGVAFSFENQTVQQASDLLLDSSPLCH